MYILSVHLNSNITLQADFDRASRRINDLETENADLKARLDNSNIQLTQRNKENAHLKKQLEDAERALKAATVDAATLKNKLESCKSCSRLFEPNRFAYFNFSFFPHKTSRR